MVLIKKQAFDQWDPFLRLFTTVTTQHIPQWFIKINSELSMIWYWDFYIAKCQIHLLAYVIMNFI